MFEKFSDYEKKMMEDYIDAYAFEDSSRGVSLKTILKPWEDGKSAYLYKLLGEQFIISKHIVANKSMQEIEDTIDRRLLAYTAPTRKFYENFDRQVAQQFWYWNKNNGEENESMRAIYNGLAYLTSTSDLATNKYSGNTFSIMLPNSGKEYKVCTGCKVSKVLGKIANAYGVEGFEEFRLLHSQILNEKSIEGELCLSIHPMDYMTMSDNNCNWSSCMNWINHGEYHRGTVEMMTSPMVVVAYLKANEKFIPVDGYEWNNKRWRELFIVNSNMIAGIKGYPYWNRELETKVIEWLKELAETNLDADGCYNNDILKFRNRETNTIYDKPVYIDIWADAMYNDIYDVHQAIFSKTIGKNIEFGYSGPSICMSCGSIDARYDDEGCLVCLDCEEHIHCMCCECRIYGDDYHVVDGEAVCQDCYDDMPCCDDCGDVHFRDNLNRIYLAIDAEHISNYDTIYLCDDCYTKYVGKIKKVTMEWYSDIHYILISDIEDNDDLIGRFGYASAKDFVNSDHTWKTLNNNRASSF